GLPFAQRRQRDGEDVEAVVEVFAETALGDQLRQVAVGGRHDADVRDPRARAAEAQELPFLDDAQQLRLRAGRQLADLVEEQDAARGTFEVARPCLHGTRVRATLCAEQLGLEQRVGYCRAVEADERA